MNKRLKGFRTAKHAEYYSGAEQKQSISEVVEEILDNQLAIIREIVEEKKQSKPKKTAKHNFFYNIYNQAIDDILAELK